MSRFWILLWLITSFCWCLSQSQSFIQQIDSIKLLLDEKISSYERVDLINDISYVFRRIHPDSTLFYAQKALSLAVKEEYEEGIAEGYKNAGIAHYKLGSKRDTIVFYYNQAIKYAEKIEDYYTQIAVWNNIGLINIHNLNYNLALQNYFDALEIHEKHIGEPNRLLALIYGNIGLINFKLEKFERALAYYKKCLQVAQELNLPSIYSIYMDEQVQTKMALNQYEEAISDIEKVLPLQEKLGDWESKMETLFNYAEIEIKLKQFESAFEHANEALKISEQYGFLMRSSYALLSMSHATMGQGKSTEALRYANEAREKGIKANLPLIEVQAFELLHQLYAQVEEMDSAYMYLVRLDEAKERISNSRYEEIAADLDAKLDIQEREREIEQLQMDKSQQRKFILISSGISILFLGLLLLAIRLYWQKNVAANLLNVQNVALESTNQELRLAEEALNQKNEELNTYIASNMQLENFAYLASHDLREPITNVMGFSDYLIKNYADGMDETGKDCLRFIQDSSKRMQYLTSDLLTYSIIGQDKNFEKVSVDQILGDVMQDLATRITGTQTTLHSPSLPQVKGKYTEIRMLFQNIISNAIKYKKPNESPKIELGYRDKSDFIEFFIRDNGVGIAPEFHDKIFVMFKRNNIENKYSGNSTGIGLAICKRVVESQNGKIWVDSKEGMGSTFYFTLPKVDRGLSI